MNVLLIDKVLQIPTDEDIRVTREVSDKVDKIEAVVKNVDLQLKTDKILRKVSDKIDSKKKRKKRTKIQNYLQLKIDEDILRPCEFFDGIDSAIETEIKNEDLQLKTDEVILLPCEFFDEIDSAIEIEIKYVDLQLKTDEDIRLPCGFSDEIDTIKTETKNVDFQLKTDEDIRLPHEFSDEIDSTIKTEIKYVDLQLKTEEVIRRTREFSDAIDTIKKAIQNVDRQVKSKLTNIQENQLKIQQRACLPYLVSTVHEIFDNELQEQEEPNGAAMYADDQNKKKCVIIKTSHGSTELLPNTGLVNEMELKPGDLVVISIHSKLIIEKLPPEYDPRSMGMELDERPTQRYSDIGGLNQQIQEVMEAIILPLTHREKFDKIGIHPPNGVLIYGPPGTGKSLLARVCAAQTNATFLKFYTTQLLGMCVGGGVKVLRDAFKIAKLMAPTIIFIDGLDVIGTRRLSSSTSGDREMQRIMLELLHQLDGFSATENIKVIAATSRVDILDPALLRSGHFDRKIEFTLPNEVDRNHILRIHSRIMKVSSDINYDELARVTDTFSGAQCKAVCCEAGMIALRRNANFVNHEDFLEAVTEVRGRQKSNLSYYV